MSRYLLGPLDQEPVNVRPPFDVRVPSPAPPLRRLIGPDTAWYEWRTVLRVDRAAAVLEPLDGLPLGIYDHQTAEWLAGFDIPTIGGVVSLLHRARAARPLGSTS
jgi:hypothetical protein